MTVQQPDRRKKTKQNPEIRVALTDSDFQFVYHDSVTISLNGEETVYEAEALRGRNEDISSRSRKEES